MLARNVRLVTFDVTHTLLQFKYSPGELYGRVAAKHGVTISADDAAKNFKSNFKQMLSDHPNFGKNSIGWHEWWKVIVTETMKDYSKDATVVSKIASELIDLYKTQEAWRISEGGVDLLKFLRDKRVALGVISNSDPRLNDVLKNKNIHHYFKFVLNSYDVDCMKPEPKIFKIALNKSELPDMISTNALHVGDDYELDYRGAIASGWKASMINKKTREDIPKDDAFSSLGDLHRYFMENNMF